MSFNDIMKLVWQITITLGFILHTKTFKDLYELHKNEKFKNDLREENTNIRLKRLLRRINELEREVNKK